MINKYLGQEVKNRKVLHKVRKKWVVVSIAFLGALSMSSLSHASAHASKVAPIQQESMINKPTTANQNSGSSNVTTSGSASTSSQGSKVSKSATSSSSITNNVQQQATQLKNNITPQSQQNNNHMITTKNVNSGNNNISSNISQPIKTKISNQNTNNQPVSDINNILSNNPAFKAQVNSQIMKNKAQINTKHNLRATNNNIENNIVNGRLGTVNYTYNRATGTFKNTSSGVLYPIYDLKDGKNNIDPSDIKHIDITGPSVTYQDNHETEMRQTYDASTNYKSDIEGGLFGNLSNVTSIDAPSLNISQSNHNMFGMFSTDPKLSSIKLNSDIDTSQVSDMAIMFEKDNMLHNIDNVLKLFNTTNVREMQAMFWHAGIQSLDLSNWNTIKAMTTVYRDGSTGTNQMLNDSMLSDIKLGANTPVEKPSAAVTGWYKKYTDNNGNTYTLPVSASLAVHKNLAGEYTTHYNPSPEENATGMWGNVPYMLNFKTGVLQTTGSGTLQPLIPSYTYNTKNHAYKYNIPDMLLQVLAHVKTIKFSKGVVAPRNSTHLFGSPLGVTSTPNGMLMRYTYLPQLQTIDCSNLDLSQVHDAFGMFENDYALKNVIFDNSHEQNLPISDTQYMFYNDYLLSKINFANMNITDKSMQSMFKNDLAIQAINLGNNFDTSHVTSMDRLFDNDAMLSNLSLGNKFNTNNVSDMKYMFYNNNSLPTLDLSNFNTSKVRYMSYMFYNDDSLQNLNLGNNFDTSNVVSMSHLFADMSGLTSLNLGTKFNTNNTKIMNNLFQNDTNLQTLNFGNNFNTTLASTKTTTNNMAHDIQNQGSAPFTIKIQAKTLKNGKKIISYVKTYKPVVTHTTGISNMFSGDTNLNKLILNNTTLADINPQTRTTLLGHIKSDMTKALNNEIHYNQENNTLKYNSSDTLTFTPQQKQDIQTQINDNANALIATLDMPKHQNEEWTENNTKLPYLLNDGQAHTGTVILESTIKPVQTELNFTNSNNQSIGKYIIQGMPGNNISYATLSNLLGNGYRPNINDKVLMQTFPNTAYQYKDGTVNIPVTQSNINSNDNNFNVKPDGNAVKDFEDAHNKGHIIPAPLPPKKKPAKPNSNKAKPSSQSSNTNHSASKSSTQSKQSTSSSNQKPASSSTTSSKANNVPKSSASTTPSINNRPASQAQSSSISMSSANSLNSSSASQNISSPASMSQMSSKSSATNNKKSKASNASSKATKPSHKIKKSKNNKVHKNKNRTNRINHKKAIKKHINNNNHKKNTKYLNVHNKQNRAKKPVYLYTHHKLARIPRQTVINNAPRLNTLYDKPNGKIVYPAQNTNATPITSIGNNQPLQQHGNTLSLGGGMSLSVTSLNSMSITVDGQKIKFSIHNIKDINGQAVIILPNGKKIVLHINYNELIDKLKAMKKS